MTDVVVPRRWIDFKEFIWSGGSSSLLQDELLFPLCKWNPTKICQISTFLQIRRSVKCVPDGMVFCVSGDCVLLVCVLVVFSSVTLCTHFITSEIRLPGKLWAANRVLGFVSELQAVAACERQHFLRVLMDVTHKLRIWFLFSRGGHASQYSECRQAGGFVGDLFVLTRTPARHVQ